MGDRDAQQVVVANREESCRREGGVVDNCWLIRERSKAMMDADTIRTLFEVAGGGWGWREER